MVFKAVSKAVFNRKQYCNNRNKKNCNWQTRVSKNNLKMHTYIWNVPSKVSKSKSIYKRQDHLEFDDAMLDSRRHGNVYFVESKKKNKLDLTVIKFGNCKMM